MALAKPKPTREPTRQGVVDSETEVDPPSHMANITTATIIATASAFATSQNRHSGGQDRRNGLEVPQEAQAGLAVHVLASLQRSQCFVVSSRAGRITHPKISEPHTAVHESRATPISYLTIGSLNRLLVCICPPTRHRKERRTGPR